VIPFTTPPVYPPIAPGRLAATIQRASAELLDRPAAVADVAKCRVAIIGLADDTGVAMNHGRPGARDGPAAFRAALARYGVAARMDEPDGQSFPHVCDVGDIVPGRSLDETHHRVTQAVRRLLELGQLPVGIGGGHDLTFPFVRAVIEHRAARGEAPLTAGLYVDPHLDVRLEPGSGMAFRSLVEHAQITELANLGVEPLVNSREHGRWFHEHGGRVLPNLAAAEHWIASRTSPAFVSLDLDCLDAAYAPGVSALNPNGMAPGDLAAIARAAGRAPCVACFDLMELNPVFDPEHRTARVASYLFLSFLSGLAERWAR
jgi:formiminoglutamase